MVSGKWVAIALTASLAVNVFLAGLFVGRQMMMPPPLGPAGMPRGGWHPGDRGLPPFVGRIADRMSPRNRSIFVAAMKRHEPAIMTAGTALHDARGKVRQTLGADPFDRGTAETAMTELRERTGEFEQQLQAAFLDAAQALPPDGRQEMIHPERRGPPR